LTNSDNFGIFLATLITPFTTGSFTKDVLLIDQQGASQNMRIWGLNSANNFNKLGSFGQTQIGKGLSPATRQDIVIENPFTNGGVEDNLVPSSIFGYNSGLGKITVATMITPTAGSGSITEVTHICVWQATTGLQKAILLTRDTLSPIAFLTGQTVDVEHIWLI